MKILVTGAAGFIGKNFVLTHKDFNLVLVDKLSQVSDAKMWSQLCWYQKKRADIRYILASDLEEWGITHVVNFAAESHVDRSIKNPISFTDANIVSTHYLLEACRKYGKIEKFIQVSTDEVYGSLGKDDKPFTEQSPLRPSSPYSASKLGQDNIAMAYFHTYGLPVCITRCSNNYGLGQHKEKLIPKIVNSILNFTPIHIYGDGSNVRDWIHVNDHCNGIRLVLEKGIAGNVYNLGGNSERTNLEVVNLILGYFKNEINIDGSSLIKLNVVDRPGHDFRYAIDSSFAEKEIGFKPSIKFEDGLCGYLDYTIKGVC